MSRMTSKGQVTIPKNIRQRLGLTPGCEVRFAVGKDGQIVLEEKNAADRGPSRFDAIRGTLDLGVSTDEFMRFLRGEGPAH